LKGLFQHIAPYYQAFGKWSQAGLCLILLIGLWSFAGKRQRSRVINKIDISIENSLENHFVDAEEIGNAIGIGPNNLVYMRWFDSISLKKIERRIERIEFVKSAQASHDLEGNLFIKVKLVKPIARIVNGGSDNDRYLGGDGEILPTSEKYVSKVVTIDGPGSRKLIYRHQKADSTISQLTSMLQFIETNAFWKAQIAHITLSEKNELTLIPEVGDHQIEFGTATDVEEKFKKLEAFYQKIIPVKGWKAYNKVSIKFKNQIVCQKSS